MGYNRYANQNSAAAGARGFGAVNPGGPGQSGMQRRTGKPTPSRAQLHEEGTSSEAPEDFFNRVDSPIYSGEIGSDRPLISIDSSSVLRGIIFSEILGKPKSRRMGR